MPIQMSTDECIALAKEIFVMKVIFNPSWDIQQIARDSLNMAMQFSLAVQDAQAPDKTPADGPAQPDSPQSSVPTGTGSAESAASAPPDSASAGSSSGTLPDTTTTAPAAEQSSAEGTAAADPQTAPAASTASSPTQSQSQS